MTNITRSHSHYRFNVLVLSFSSTIMCTFALNYGSPFYAHDSRSSLRKLLMNVNMRILYSDQNHVINEVLNLALNYLCKFPFPQVQWQTLLHGHFI